MIRGARLGNPHGERDIEAADGLWTAEIAQPWIGALDCGRMLGSP